MKYFAISMELQNSFLNLKIIFTFFLVNYKYTCFMQLLVLLNTNSTFHK